MEEEKKDLLKNFAGIALTTGLALATQGTSSVALGVLSGIAGNLASSFIEKTEYNKVRNLLQNKGPVGLNHDLKKLVVKSVSWAIRNIEILYKEKLSSQDEVKTVKDFTRRLLGEVKTLEDSLLAESKSLYKTIESAKDTDEVLATFNMDIDDIPEINPDIPFNVFFKEQFIPNLQLCFGELLKQEKNRPALLAYQREVYQNLTASIDTVIAQNNAILEKTETKARRVNQNAELTAIRKLLASAPRHKLNSLFVASLNNQLTELSAKTDILLGKSDAIKAELEEVRRITKGIDRDLKTRWIEKNKAWVIAVIAIAILTIAGLVYYLNNLPFQMNLGLEVDKTVSIHPEYPPVSETAHIRIYLPSETKEKEITSSNEIILADLSASLSGTVSRIELMDPYWQLGIDSIQLKEGHLSMPVLPNASLSKIEGRVLSRDGQELLSSADVSVDNIHGKTDGAGRFSLTMPMSARRLKYTLRVELEGYETVEEEYISGSEKEIRLIKK